MDVAKKSGFDPLIAENWYSLNPEVTKELSKSYMIHEYYKGDENSKILHENLGGVTKAIHDLFPEIGLKQKPLTRILVDLLPFLSLIFSFI